jgi:hypothetical protein
MIETIKTFWSKIRGLRGDRRIITVEGLVWRCTKCHHIFLTEVTAKEHTCPDQKVS